MATLKLTTRVRVADDVLLVATWHGGPYIELARYGYAPVEAINVWDYDADTTTIPVAQKALARRVRDWVAEYPAEDLAHDVREHWYR